MVMLVRATVKASDIEGVGLFADHDIKKGTMLWKYMPPIDQAYTLDQINNMDPILKEFMGKYAYFHGRTNMYILCGDNGRFYNHSSQPNTLGMYPDGHEEGIDVALRDIKQGEELTCDYTTFDLDARVKIKTLK